VTKMTFFAAWIIGGFLAGTPGCSQKNTSDPSDISPPDLSSEITTDISVEIDIPSAPNWLWCPEDCGDCPDGASCVAGQCVTCTPDCGDAQCGPDGCGGRCGTCGTDEICIAGKCASREDPCSDGNDIPWDGCTDGEITETALTPVLVGGVISAAVDPTDTARVVAAWNDLTPASPYHTAVASVRFPVPTGLLPYHPLVEPGMEDRDAGDHVQVAMYPDGMALVSWGGRHIPSYVEIPRRLQVFDRSGGPTDKTVDLGLASEDVQGAAIAINASGITLAAWEEGARCGGLLFPGKSACWVKKGSQLYLAASPPCGDSVVSAEPLAPQPPDAAPHWNQVTPQVLWKTNDIAHVFWLIQSVSDYDKAEYYLVGLSVDSNGSALAPVADVLPNNWSDALGGYDAERLFDGAIVVTVSMMLDGYLKKRDNDRPLWGYPNDGEGQGVWGQRLSEDGIRIGDPFLINQYWKHDQHSPSIDSFPDGRWVVVWVSQYQDADYEGIFARIFAPEGEPLTDEFPVNKQEEGRQFAPEVVVLSNDEFAVFFNGPCGGAADCEESALFVQRFDAVGNRLYR
jgi:hypothetical protein